MADKKVLAKVTEVAGEDKRLPCAKAMKIAEELGVAPKRVGEAADELKVKIGACQLGCFE